MSLPKEQHNWASRNIIGLIFLGVFLGVGSFTFYIASLHAESIIITMEVSCEELEAELAKIQPQRSTFASPSLQFAYNKYFEECI